MPAVPVSAARALAWYVAENEAILAPRGWQCFEVYGSNGGTLVVAPQPLSFNRILGEGATLRGPVVLSTYTFGGTSGRWAVVEMIARYFPGHHAFIQEVRDMGFDLGTLPTGPHRGDRIVSRTPTEIRLITPPGRRGEGTSFRLTPNHEPVESLIILHPASDMDASTVTIRLPRALAGLSPAILQQARRTASRH